MLLLNVHTFENLNVQNCPFSKKKNRIFNSQKGYLRKTFFQVWDYFQNINTIPMPNQFSDLFFSN